MQATIRVVVLVMACLPALATSGLELDSPRETFRTFLDAVNEARDGAPGRIDDAAACFDLESAPLLVRSEGERLARELKTYLDKVELIRLEEIPDELDADSWVWRRNRHGEISMVRTAGDRWLFSARTIADIPQLLDSVRSDPFLKGLEGGGAASTLADWVRERLPDRLTLRFFLLERWQWIALLFLALAGVIVDRLTRWVLGAWVRRLLAASSELRERGSDGDFAKPIGILAMALVWRVLLPAVDLVSSAYGALRFAAQIVIAAAGVWAAYRLVDLLSAHFTAMAARTESRVDDILVPLLRRALKIVVVAFGVLFVAQNLDVDITSLLAGLGLGGLAFALAAKDTVENVFGSVTVLIDRPFQIGDWVVIGDEEGTVESIGFRSTRVRTFYNSQITIPNSSLVNAAVDNLGARRYRRIKSLLSLQYDTPPERIEAFCEGVRELIRRHPHTRKDYYMVYFNAFGPSSLDVLLYTFLETPDWPTELREKHRLFTDIVRLAASLGVHFAYPTQTMHLVRAGEESTYSPEKIGGDEGRRIAGEIVGDTRPRPPVDFGDPTTFHAG